MEYFITPALAETLRKLEALAQIGEWIIPEKKQDNVEAKRITQLALRGFLELRQPDRTKPRHVRVIVPSNTEGVTMVDTYYRSPEVIERLRESAAKQAANMPKRKLIRYAGFDGSSNTAW